MEKQRFGHLQLQRGITLLEALIVIAIAGYLTVVAVPSFNNIIKDNRLVSVANELLTSLSLARSTAIANQRRTVVCPSANPTAATPACSDDNWKQGWIVFTDNNANNAYDPGGDPPELLVEQHGPMRTDVSIGAGAFVKKYVRFAPLGMVVNGQVGTLQICDDRKSNSKYEDRMKQVVVSFAGRAVVRDGKGENEC